MLTKSFLGREDPALTDELLAEAPEIFNWALRGLDRLNQRGYFLTPESGRESVQQLEDLSSPVSAFVRDQCRIGPEERVTVEDLWGSWRSWCESENRHPGTKAVFGRNLKAAVPMIRKARPKDSDERVHVYHGIGPARKTMEGHGDFGDADVGTGQDYGTESRQTPNNDGPGHRSHSKPELMEEEVVDV